jgi:hypothetical protein
MKQRTTPCIFEDVMMSSRLCGGSWCPIHTYVYRRTHLDGSALCWWTKCGNVGFFFKIVTKWTTKGDLPLFANISHRASEFCRETFLRLIKQQLKWMFVLNLAVKIPAWQICLSYKQELHVHMQYFQAFSSSFCQQRSFYCLSKNQSVQTI